MANTPITYGNLQSEKIALENTQARQIVREINQFEINDRQRWIIIHLLCLELENVEDMKAMTSLITARKGKDLFLSKIYGSDEGNDE